MGGKDVDNKENKSLLKGAKEIKEDHSIHTKPKNGSELGYTKGADSESESGKTEGKSGDKTETGKPGNTEPDKPEKTGGPGSGEPHDD